MEGHVFSPRSRKTPGIKIHIPNIILNVDSPKSTCSSAVEEWITFESTFQNQKVQILKLTEEKNELLHRCDALRFEVEASKQTNLELRAELAMQGASSPHDMISDMESALHDLQATFDHELNLRTRTIEELEMELKIAKDKHENAAERRYLERENKSLKKQVDRLRVQFENHKARSVTSPRPSFAIGSPKFDVGSPSFDMGSPRSVSEYFCKSPTGIRTSEGKIPVLAVGESPMFKFNQQRDSLVVHMTPTPPPPAAPPTSPQREETTELQDDHTVVDSCRCFRVLHIAGDTYVYDVLQAVQEWTPMDVSMWCARIRQGAFRKFSRRFLGNKIDGKKLLKMSSSELADVMRIDNGALCVAVVEEIRALRTQLPMEMRVGEQPSPPALSPMYSTNTFQFTPKSTNQVVSDIFFEFNSASTVIRSPRNA